MSHKQQLNGKYCIYFATVPRLGWRISTHGRTQTNTNIQAYTFDSWRTLQGKILSCWSGFELADGSINTVWSNLILTDKIIAKCRVLSYVVKLLFCDLYTTSFLQKIEVRVSLTLFIPKTLTKMYWDSLAALWCQHDDFLALFSLSSSSLTKVILWFLP